VVGVAVLRLDLEIFPLLPLHRVRHARAAAEGRLAIENRIRRHPLQNAAAWSKHKALWKAESGKRVPIFSPDRAMLSTIRQPYDGEEHREMDAKRDRFNTTLNKLELEKMSNGYCPNIGCGHRGFRLGPQAGSAINVECCGCGTRFKVTNVGWVIVRGERLGSSV
jgi:hypothetical protein